MRSSAPPVRRSAAATAATLLLLAACGAPPRPASDAEAGGSATLASSVQARLDSLDAVSALYARHLPTGREVAVRADRVMNTLSVIKLAAMVRAYRLAEAGELDLDARRPVEAEHMRGGSGLLRTFQPGLEPTLRDLVTQMIITSDNTATDLVLEAVGRDEVNRMLDSLGYAETRFRMSTGEIFAELDARLAAAREAEGEGFDADRVIFDFEGDSTVWLGRSTPRETALLLEQIHAGELASEEHSREMEDILRRQLYTSRLPRIVRGDVAIGHKTGDWPPHAGNDVGLIYYQGGPLVVAVYVNQNRGDFRRVERTMGVIAEELVRAWDGEGALR